MSYVSHCLIKLFVIFFPPSDSGNLSNLGAAIGNCVKRINKWSVQINKDKKKEREGESVNERIENLTKQIKNTGNKLNRDFVGSSHMMRMINNSFRYRYKYCIYNDSPL